MEKQKEEMEREKKLHTKIHERYQFEGSKKGSRRNQSGSGGVGWFHLLTKALIFTS